MNNANQIIIPMIVFFAGVIVLLWLRKRFYNLWEKRIKKGNKKEEKIILDVISLISIFLCLILPIYPAIGISVLPPAAKELIFKVAGTLFFSLLGLIFINLSHKFLPLYVGKLKLPHQGVKLSGNIIRIIIIAVFSLILLDIWGVPLSSLFFLLAIIILSVGIILRDIISDFVAYLEINSGSQIKKGDYIKLENGEEGNVAEITWRNVRINSLEKTTIFIPNNKIIKSGFVNYGRPLKTAKTPFAFYSRVYLKETTGIKARTLKEMKDILKEVPDSVLYYHIHRFLEEHHYLVPEPSNDFAIWVKEALGEESLGERLAAVDVYDFPSLGELRREFIKILEEFLGRDDETRHAVAGRELYFMKSISVILPTPYVAHNLREFAEALKKISPGCLYFHIFEARLRLGKGLNDFSSWLEDNLDKKELAHKIMQLDPYNHTLEGLRTKLVNLIEGDLL